jgi:hypothetical protein
VFVDPTKLVPVAGKQVAAHDRDAFKVEVDKLAAKLSEITIPTGAPPTHPVGT